MFQHEGIRSCMAMQVKFELEILILTKMFVEFNVQYYFHNKIIFVCIQAIFSHSCHLLNLST
jgi:hypothetical protein